MPYRVFLISLFWILCSKLAALGQVQDSLVLKDTTAQTNWQQTNESDPYYYKTTASYIAKRAGLKSALIPGWGQLQNKQYWKIPLIYATLGFLGYYINKNYNGYIKYSQAYVYKIDGNPSTEIPELANVNVNVIQSYQELYRKSLDYSVLFAVVAYALNIIDAIVYSHLKTFDIDNNLTVRPKIGIQYLPMANNYGIQMGMSLQLK